MSSSRRHRGAAAAGIALLMTAVPASAFDRAACFKAASEGQTQRDAHLWVEARESFRICAQPECPASMRGDCAAWLGEVEAMASAPVAAPSRASGPEPATVAAAAAAPPETGAQSDPIRTVAWITGGAGVLAVVVGTAAGITAVADKGAAHCDAANRCDGPALDAARGAATVADVSLVAGALLLGTSVALFVLPPRHDAGSALTITPVLSATRAGLSLGGSF